MLKNTFSRFPFMDADGAAGGAGDTGGDAGTGDKGPTVAELQAQLDAINAENAKHKQAITNLSAENAEKKRLLAEKMTAEEKAQADQQAIQDEIDRLKKEREDERLETNKSLAETLTSSVREIADIKETDADFPVLVEALTTTDKEATKKLAGYLSKVVKQAYDKGVADTKADDTKKTSTDVKVGGGDDKTTDFEKFQKNQVKLKDKVDLK